MQHGAIVDRQRRALGVLPSGSRLAAFEEWKAVGIEQPTAVGRQLEVVVPDAAVDRAKVRQQPAPGIMAAFKDFLAKLVCRGPKLFADRGDGIMLVVKL